MNSLNDVLSTLLEMLKDEKWDVLSAFPTDGKKAPKKPVLTIAAESCESSPCGFGGLLGVKQDLSGYSDEVFAVWARMAFSIGIYVRDPGKNASDTLSALVSRVFKKLWENPPADIRIHQVSAGKITFDEVQHMFFCPIKLLCSSFHTFSGEEALPIHIDLSGRIHYELCHQ